MDNIQEIMTKVFWDILKDDLERTPQKFDQVINLIEEIRERLKKLVYQSKTMKNELDEHIDGDFLKQLFQYKAFDEKSFYNLIFYLIHKLKQFCSPARDQEIIAFEEEMKVRCKDTVVYSEFIPWFITEYHSHIDNIEKDIIEFQQRCSHT